jgi:hypothetical protein
MGDGCAYLVNEVRAQANTRGCVSHVCCCLYGTASMYGCIQHSCMCAGLPVFGANAAAAGAQQLVFVQSRSYAAMHHLLHLRPLQACKPSSSMHVCAICIGMLLVCLCRALKVAPCVVASACCAESSSHEYVSNSFKKNKKKHYNTGSSRVITYPITNPAQTRLSAEV